MKKSLILTGFMGTGKSTIGALAARKSGAMFVDTDMEIERRAGKSISQIFEDEGEAYFRKLESDVCQKMAITTQRVIATGGGAFLNPATKQLFLENCVVANLHCSLAEIEKRLMDDKRRPLLKDRKAFRALYASRAALYNALPHQILVDDKTPLLIVSELVKLWTQYG